jgi:flagellar hook-length control protein FliK
LAPRLHRTRRISVTKRTSPKVSSNLLVSSASGPAIPFGSTGGAPASAPQGKGVFAALLGSPGGNSGDAAAPAPGGLKAAIENLIGTKVAGLEFEAGTLIGVQLAGQEEALSLADLARATGVDLDALAALHTDGKSTGNGDAAKLLAGLADLLGTIGDPPDEEILNQVGETIDAIAAALDLPLTASLTPEKLAEIGARQLVEGASLADKLKGALADIAGKLIASADGAETLSAEIGKKLGAFIAALEEASAEGDLFAKLGLATATQPADADLEASIAALLAKPGGKASAEVQQTPAATTPQLDEPTTAAGTNPTAKPETNGRNAETPPRRADTATKAATGSAETAPKALDTLATQAAVQSGTRIDIAPGAKPVVAGYQTSQQQINLPQIAFEIVRQVHQGNTQFLIRLDPPELGRIDVRMDIDTSGNVNARLIVEKAETLDLMQRDQRALERALAQAGLDSSKTNLEFSLKQNPFAQQGQDQQSGNERDPVFNPDTTAETDENPPPTVNLYRGALSASGVNIFV